MKNKQEKVDYIFVSNKKNPEKYIEPSRKVVKSRIIGTTLVQKVIDKNYQQILTGGRYGQGIE